MDKKKLFDNIINVTKIVAPAVVTQQVYDKMFNHHFHTFTPFYFTIEDFPNLTSERHEFYSDNKSKLVGYIYKYKNSPQNGLFVFADCAVNTDLDSAKLAEIAGLSEEEAALLKDGQLIEEPVTRRTGRKMDATSTAIAATTTMVPAVLFSA